MDSQGAALAVGVSAKTTILAETPDTLAWRVGGLAETVRFEHLYGEKTVCEGHGLPETRQFSWLEPRARCPKVRVDPRQLIW